MNLIRLSRSYTQSGFQCFMMVNQANCKHEEYDVLEQTFREIIVWLERTLNTQLFSRISMCDLPNHVRINLDDPKFAMLLVKFLNSGLTKRS